MPRRNSWADWEDDILREYWPSLGMDVVALLPHRTGDACRVRACKLKLHVDPQYRPERCREAPMPTLAEIRERAAAILAAREPDEPTWEVPVVKARIA